MAADSPCSADQFWCTTVWNGTENTTAARLADFVIGRPLAVLAILLAGILVRWLLHRAIDRVAQRAEHGAASGPKVGRIALGGGDRSRRAQRARTMGSLLKSVTTIVVLTITVVMALSEFGVNVAPLLAGAGIVGLALGFGAQSLVQDFLSGVFMMFEDQYGVGDWIDVGECDGEVEAVSLRVTRLRDLNGTVWYVRNGEILRVGNFSQNWARTVLDVAVAYNEDIPRVRRILEEASRDLWEDADFKGLILEPPELWGVQEVANRGVIMRVALKTAPLQQWGIGRELRARIKARFDQEGIRVPYPEWVLGEGAGHGAAAYYVDDDG